MPSWITGSSDACCIPSSPKQLNTKLVSRCNYTIQPWNSLTYHPAKLIKCILGGGGKMTKCFQGNLSFICWFISRAHVGICFIKQKFGTMKMIIVLEVCWSKQNLKLETLSFGVTLLEVIFWDHAWINSFSEAQG